MPLPLWNGIRNHADAAERIHVTVAAATAPSFWPARSRSIPVLRVEM